MCSREQLFIGHPKISNQLMVEGGLLSYAGSCILGCHSCLHIEHLKAWQAGDLSPGPSLSVRSCLFYIDFLSPLFPRSHSRSVLRSREYLSGRSHYHFLGMLFFQGL